MQKQMLEVEKRDAVGKGPARRLRAQGSIPAVVYGMGSSTPVTVNRKDLVRILSTGSGASSLFSLRFKGASDEKLAIIREFRTDPVKNTLVHADFLEVAADKPIEVTVALTLADGEIMGVKEGGILQQPLRDVHVECLPLNIPEGILVDASGLGIGETLHLSDVTFPEGVKPVTDLDQVVVTIAAPVSAEKLEEMLSAEPEKEVKEPEVEAKGKESDEAE